LNKHGFGAASWLDCLQANTSRQPKKQRARPHWRRAPSYPEPVKVAAYQPPLLSSGSMCALWLIRERVEWCAALGISVLCCPEGILGGLADYGENPAHFAIRTDDDQLASVLAPLGSETVTLIVGFTELTGDGKLYNTAAVVSGGRLSGLYRKLHPAMRRSIYTPGSQMPVFHVGPWTFGVAICNDSNYSEPARVMAAQGAPHPFCANKQWSSDRERRAGSSSRGKEGGR
jgi:predicted amidohydrolase